MPTYAHGHDLQVRCGAEPSGGRFASIVRRSIKDGQEKWLTVATATNTSDVEALRDLWCVMRDCADAVTAAGRAAKRLDGQKGAQ